MTGSEPPLPPQPKRLTERKRRLALFLAAGALALAVVIVLALAWNRSRPSARDVGDIADSIRSNRTDLPTFRPTPGTGRGRSNGRGFNKR